MSDVFVLGDLNLDVIMQVDRYPGMGEDVRSEHLHLAAGGSAANSACMLSSLGHETQLLAAVGEDPFADIARGQLADLGVGLDHVETIDGQPTGLMFVPVTPDGERTLFGRRGANLDYEPATLPIKRIISSNWLHVSGYALLEPPQAEACAKAVQAAVKAGVPVSLDTAYEPPLVSPQAFRELLPQLSLLVLGEQEAQSLAQAADTADSVQLLHGMGVPRIALKLGHAGSRLSEIGQAWDIPALPVETVDSTGAGDGFSGALVCGHLWDLSFPAAGLLASAAAALVTTGWGASPSTPTPAAIADLLRKTSVETRLSQAKTAALAGLQAQL